MTHPRLLVKEEYDLVVVGGGINGVGIAADAAGRGLSVLVVEKSDLASATSSSSSKLIHGGLRYLENLEFTMVRNALQEREVMLRIAPHIVKPIRFRLPHLPWLRPGWMIRLGLFLYDHLAKRTSLPPSDSISFRTSEPLVDSITHGFEYSDCKVDDARLVIFNALSAKADGADILTRTCCIHARQSKGMWQVQLKDEMTGEQISTRAKCLVNATGPWAQQFLEQHLQILSPNKIKLVKGSHIVTDQLFEGEHGYVLQNEDGRIVFAIPYYERFTLIGTTDMDFDGDPANASISETEKNYLLDLINYFFKTKLSLHNIHYTFSGVRPLVDNESNSLSKISRDYDINVYAPGNEAPLLNVFGGKLTTYRRLADAAMTAIKPWFPDLGESWTSDRALPGGEFESRESLMREYRASFLWFGEANIQRFIDSYGSIGLTILAGSECLEDLGQHFGHGLYQREIEYLYLHEWALTAEDVLFRRTKIGLFMVAGEINRVQQYMGGLSDSRRR